MKWWLTMLAAVSMMAAPASKKFVGVVYDNRCVGPDCATKCPIRKGHIYTLQAKDEAFVLNGPRSIASFTGRKVVITGTPGSGNKINVVSIAPAR